MRLLTASNLPAYFIVVRNTADAAGQPVRLGKQSDMRVKKLMKIGVVVIVVAAVILVAAVIAVRLYLTPERLGAIAQSVAGTYLTTDVEIESISLKLFRSIEVRGVRVSQPEGFEGDTLASLDRVVVRFRLLPLLRRRLVITEIEVDSPHLSLNRSEDGTLNVLAALRESPPEVEAPETMEPESVPEEEPSQETGFAAEIRSFRVSECEFQFIDDSTGMDVAVKGLDVSFRGGLEADGSASAAGDVSVASISASAGDDTLAQDLAVTCSFDVALDGTQSAVQIKSIHVATLGSKLDINGAIDNLGPEAGFTVNISTEVDFYEMSQQLASFVPAVPLPVQPAGTVALGVEVAGTVQKPTVTGDISIQNLSVRDGDQRILEGLVATSSFDLGLDLIENRADINKFSFGALGIRTDLSGTVSDLGADAALDLSLSSEIDTGVMTREVATVLPLISLPVRTTGSVNVSVSVGGTVPSPDVSIDINSPSLRIEQVETDAAANSTAGGAVPAVPPEPDEVQTGQTQPIGPFDLGFLTIHLAARCGHLEYDRYEVAPIEVAAALENNKFTVENASFGIAKGTVNATSTVDLGVAGLAYSSTVSARDVDISTLLAYASPSLGETLSGRCIAEVEVTGHGTDLDRADTAISGKLHSEFVDGKVTWPAFVSALGPLLGLPDLSSIPVVTIDTSIDATEGNINVSPFVMQGSEMTLEAEGTVTTKLALDMDLTVALSRELTARISSSKDFQKYATSNGRLVVPLTVSGTLESPKLRPNLKAVAQQAVEQVREIVTEKVQEAIKEEVSEKIKEEIGEELGEEVGEILGEKVEEVLDQIVPKLEGLLDGIFKPK